MTDKEIADAARRWVKAYEAWHSGVNTKAAYDELQRSRNALLEAGK